MKRVLIAALIFLLLSFCFTSCGIIEYEKPDIQQTFSDEFLDTFLDNYSVRDPNLHYYTAEEYGGYISRAELDNKYDFNGTYSDSGYDLRISQLSNIDQTQFVLGARCRYLSNNIVFAAWEDSFYVYSHKDAPDPLLDWTVSNIQVYNIDPPFDSVTEEYKNGLGNLLKEEDIIFSWKDEGSSQALMDDILKAARGENDMQSGEMIMDMCIKHEYPARSVLVIRFEESENIFWGAELCVVGNSFAIKHYNDDVYSVDRSNPIYSKLGEPATKILNGIFPVIAEIDPERTDLPQGSDFSTVVADMSYKDIVAEIGLPQRIITDTSKIDSGCSFAVEYDTKDSGIYTIAFKRTVNGSLTAMGIDQKNNLYD